jgi:hypothetical protein
MFTLLKFLLTFTLCFILLTFPIGGKSLFETIDQYTRPYTTKIYQKSAKTFKQWFGDKASIKEKWEESEIEFPQDIVDTIKESSSAVKKTVQETVKKKKDKIMHQYENIERKELNKILRENDQ